MLNLVQLQDRLKDVPMQALMQYANGSNPQIPPFLALGELNRRKKMQEGAAAEQAQEMEGAPTVKQQIEQAAGLMALQGSRQRQAAQQQQGIQANMPMAAPNTTTSEPAQMAGGGFIDDIVVPRDYQGGGQVGPQMTPEMLKKLMMLKAMKQRQGVAGIPVGNMFKRSDYSGGGIVAFAGPQGSYVDPIGQAPWEKETEEEKAARERAEKGGILGAIRRAIAGGGDPEFYSRDIRAQKEAQRKKEIDQTMPPDVASGEFVNRKLREAAAASRQAPTSKDSETKKQSDRQIDLEKSNLPSALEEYLKINPETAIPMPASRTPEQFKQQIDEANRVFGVAQDPYAELKRRYGEIETEDKRSRAEQPMDRLMEFLAGVTEGRGGNWATQGARGARAAMALEAQQKALNRKQDLDMANLQSVIAEKEDARARGDRDRYIAASEKEKELAMSIQKDRLALRQNQAQIQNQATQARAAMIQAGRPSAGMESFQLWQKYPKEYEAFKRASGMSDENFVLRVQNAADKLLEKDLEYRTLQLSDKPEDRAKAAQKRQQAINQAMMDLQMISGGMTGGLPSGVTVTREK